MTLDVQNLSRGVLPENLSRRPYAVVDEICEDTTLDLLQRHFCLISWTLVSRFTTAPLLPHFLDPSIRIYYSATFTSFLDPSIYVVMLYEIVGGG